MSAVDSRFSELRSAGRKAFIPFITAGDPDLAMTADLLREFSARGAAVCEVGIPYSDPIADGPVIQASYTRALSRRLKLVEILKTLAGAAADASSPLVTMVSYAIIHRCGLARFVGEARAAGVAGAIVPDLLVEEADELAGICRREDFSLIQLVTPTTPRERALRIAESSTGFLYYVSVTGITGERTDLPAELTDNVGWLRGQTDLPVCIGFGVSRREHVRRLAPIADGLIVGSAIVRRLEDAENRDRGEIVTDVGEYVREMIEELNAASATPRTGGVG